MNKYLFTLLLVAICAPSFAEFKLVKSKYCNNSVVPLQSEERIYINTQKSIIGFGHTQESCRLVDFKSFVITSFSNEVTEINSSSDVGRRSSCFDGVTKYQGPSFSTAQIKANEVTLFADEIQDCQTLTFVF
jgi:hypothetical protein